MYQCNFFIEVLSSAAIALSNIQQPVPEKPVVPIIENEVAVFDIETIDEVQADEAEETHEEIIEENTAEEEIQTVDEEEYYEPETQEVFYDGFDSSFKAYMDYRCITDTGSTQYEMQQDAYTDARGFRRIGDDYCIALGTGFTNGCGERFTIYLDSGYCFNGVVSDVKSDCHTDSSNCYVPRGDNSGNVVEFIIDTDCAESAMLSSGNAGYYDDLSGNVTAVVPI